MKNLVGTILYATIIYKGIEYYGKRQYCKGKNDAFEMIEPILDIDLKLIEYYRNKVNKGEA